MGTRLRRSNLLFHIARRNEWESSDDRKYLPFGYDNEGFIHLSFASQLLATYNRYYSGQSGLVLLAINLSSESIVNLKTEDLTGRGERFPHLYRPLDKADVTSIYAVPPGGGAEAEAFFARVIESESQSD